MENKLNISELLKDCPKGMELDCTLFEGLEFDGIWLYEVAFWNSESFERSGTLEDILYWCEISDPEK